MRGDEPGGEGAIGPVQREPSLATRPFRRVGQPEAAPVRVVLHAGALDRIAQHLASDLTRELGGVLAGEVRLWEGCAYVEVQSSLPAQTPSRGPTHFTFSAETWIELDHAMEAGLPALYMVGWYHSHPRLGVFFSGQDGDVQKVVFNQPWHVGLVIDPSTGEAGFFGWADGDLRRLPGYYVLEDVAEETLRTSGSEATSSGPCRHEGQGKVACSLMRRICWRWAGLVGRRRRCREDTPGTNGPNDR
jgi:proteasome lid subunit RPN8/RPN11